MHVDALALDEIWKKQTVLWGTITWSVIGKQNLQAENVYLFESFPGNIAVDIS